MEAIREYLKNLFMSLPETPEVLRARAELMEIMEDKYEELIREGKSEKEAIGIVISEFGDLQELAGELGIEGYMKNQSEDNAKQQSGQFGQSGQSGQNGQSGQDGQFGQSWQNGAGGYAGPGGNGPGNMGTVYRWSFDDAKKYISYAWMHAIFIAVAVFLCICSPFASDIFDACGDAGYMPYIVSDALSAGMFFVFIAVAVVLFCMAREMKKRYGSLSGYSVMLDRETADYMSQKQQKDSGAMLIMKFAGIFLCIVSVVPSSINYFPGLNPLVSEIIDSSVLLIAGIGVFLLVLSGSIKNRYGELEKAVNNAADMQGMDFRYAEWRQPLKKKMPILAVLILIITGTLVVGGSIVSNIMFMRYYGADDTVISDVSEFDLGDGGKIAVDLDFTELLVVESQTADDSGLVRVEYSGNSRYKPEITMSGERLSIQEKRKINHWISFDIGWITRPAERQSHVTVILPSSRGMKDYDMEINVDAGNVACSGIQMKNLNIDLDAGNAELDNCTVTGRADIDVDAGNVEINESMIEILKGDVDAGDFKCYFTDKPLESYDMELDVDLGNITVNGSDKGGSYSQTATYTEGDSSSPRQINIEADLGNIDINVHTE